MPLQGNTTKRIGEYRRTKAEKKIPPSNVRCDDTHGSAWHDDHFTQITFYNKFRQISFWKTFWKILENILTIEYISDLRSAIACFRLSVEGSVSPLSVLLPTSPFSLPSFCVYIADPIQAACKWQLHNVIGFLTVDAHRGPYTVHASKEGKK